MSSLFFIFPGPTGPGVAGYLTAGTRTTMPDAPPPIDHGHSHDDVHWPTKQPTSQSWLTCLCLLLSLLVCVVVVVHAYSVRPYFSEKKLQLSNYSVVYFERKKKTEFFNPKPKSTNVFNPSWFRMTFLSRLIGYRSAQQVLFYPCELLLIQIQTVLWPNMNCYPTTNLLINSWELLFAP